MIKISNLQKLYRTEEIETMALNDLSIHVKEGEFVAVMGPSGCGKSTLLNIVGLLDDLDGGLTCSIRLKSQISMSGNGRICVSTISVLYFRALT